MYVPSLWLSWLYFIYYLDLSWWYTPDLSSLFDPPDSFGLCQDSALVSSSLDKVSECFMFLCCSDTNWTCLATWYSNYIITLYYTILFKLLKQLNGIHRNHDCWGWAAASKLTRQLSCLDYCKGLRKWLIWWRRAVFTSAHFLSSQSHNLIQFGSIWPPGFTRISPGWFLGYCAWWSYRRRKTGHNFSGRPGWPGPLRICSIEKDREM